MANDPIKLITVPTLDEFKTKIENEIPDSVQYSTMPTASADLVGKIVQYTGENASGLGYDLINGHWYKCETWGTGYIWTDLYTDSINNGSKPIISSAVSSALQTKQNIIQVAEMPTASSTRVGDILQYIGTTTASYTNGYFYKCVAGSTSGTYEWTPVSVQSGGGGGGGDSIQVDVLPTASASNLGKIYQYVGTTTPNRRNGFFYKCVPGDVAGTYEWANIDVQYGGIGGENHVYYDPIPEHTYLYGFDIHTLDSNPDTRVTYPLDVDNANYSPAYMDFANDVFNYGGWNLNPGQHFMPRPCMLNTDTTVAYYLNPNNYTKKEDGTNSDVANQNFDGNAMMEWNKIYTYREMDHNGTYRFRCSDVKLGPNWECWCNYDQQNNIIPHFYTRIYQGYVYSSKLRSISGQTPTDQIYMSAAIYYAGNVGNSYYPSVAVDRLLINDLLVLISKNTDTTEIFGIGCLSTVAHNTGTLNTKGMFWGTHADQSTGVKVFGMEDWWGNFYNLELGIMTTRNSAGLCKVLAKFTRGTKDGSTVSDYNNTGDGYLTLYEYSTSISGYISEMIVTPFGRFPKGADGSSTEYETDMASLQSSDYPLFVFGNGGIKEGAFSAKTATDSTSNSKYNFSLSCKPLAPMTDAHSDVDS